MLTNARKDHSVAVNVRSPKIISRYLFKLLVVSMTSSAGLEDVSLPLVVTDEASAKNCFMAQRRKQLNASHSKKQSGRTIRNLGLRSCFANLLSPEEAYKVTIYRFLQTEPHSKLDGKSGYFECCY